MEIPLKRKHRVYKPTKNNGVHGDHNNNAKHKIAGPKTYRYGSRVMLVDGLTGHAKMVYDWELNETT